MLLAFVFCTIVALSVANPLHKYPYVFLLDVGNEELEKTNTEQLRISIPGGSLSMKYPAMGEGDPITHVRVSGIDFGTDLKVNIVGGGPGFRYVVLMFMGNPGVNYDAVVTLQTLHTLPKGTEESIVNINEIISTKKIAPNSYEVSDADSDDYDLGKTSVKDSKNMKQYSKKTKEVTQASSTFYNYAKGGLTDDNVDEETQNVSSEDQDDNDETEDEADETESDFSNDGEHENSNEDEPSDQEEGASDVGEKEHEGDESVKPKRYNGRIYGQFVNIPRAEQYRSNIEPNNSDNDKPADIVDDSLYDKYEALKPHFGVGFRVYPQSFIYSKPYQVNSAYNKEDPVEFQQMLNDEEVHNDARFKDGSNSIDSDYPVAEY